jgi:hypothetical protein
LFFSGLRWWIDWKKIEASSRFSMVVTTTSAAASRSRRSTGASSRAKWSSRSCWSRSTRA